MGFGIHTKIKHFFGISKLENQIIILEKQLEDKKNEARDAAIITISCKLSWAINKINHQGGQIIELKDKIEQIELKLKEIDSISIEMGNLENWIDVLKSNHNCLTETVYSIKSKIDQ